MKTLRTCLFLVTLIIAIAISGCGSSDNNQTYQWKNVMQDTTGKGVLPDFY